MSRHLIAPATILALAGCSNAVPGVRIDSPTSGGAFYADRTIAVFATVSDANHDLEELMVRWRSDLEGVVDGPDRIDESGVVAGDLSLGEGLHVLTVEVEDPRGDVSWATVALDVAATNTAPTCLITGLTDGGAVLTGSEVDLGVLVGDPDIGAEALNLTLGSDLDGDLGALSVDGRGLGSTTLALSDGTHQLTLTATDELGAVCEDRILFTWGNPPTVAITAPAVGFVEDLEQIISFSGLVAHQVDAAADLEIRWSSDVIGIFDVRPANLDGLVTHDVDNLPRGPHTVTLRATDSLGFYAEDSVEVLVNGPPSAPTIRMLTPTPATDEPLVVEITEASQDLESDPLTVSYAWYLDDVLVPDLVEDSVPAERTVRDQSWRVEVRANDGRLDGAPGVVSVGVLNSAPIVDSVALSPSDPRTNDLVTATAEASDLDGDGIAFDYEWSVNGSVVPDATGPTLDGASHFDKDDSISVSVVPRDDVLSGEAAASTAITAVNSPPGAPIVEMDPGYTRGDEAASCLITEDVVDDDGDPVTYTVTWEADGAAYPSEFAEASGPDTVEETDDTVPADDQDLADTFTCWVTASDGTDASAAVSDYFDVATSFYEVGYWLEFPYTSIYARNYLLGHPILVTRDMTVVELGIIAKRTASNGKIALYTDNLGQPDELVIGSALQRIVVGTNQFPVRRTAIKAGTYWLMAVFDATAYMGEDRSGRHNVYYQSMTATGDFPDSISAPSSFYGYHNNYYIYGYE
ncbi:MAG: hypothetical protein AAFV53_00890 [Myxococcota bacterium]